MPTMAPLVVRGGWKGQRKMVIDPGRLTLDGGVKYCLLINPSSPRTDQFWFSVPCCLGLDLLLGIKSDLAGNLVLQVEFVGKRIVEGIEGGWLGECRRWQLPWVVLTGQNWRGCDWGGSAAGEGIRRLTRCEYSHRCDRPCGWERAQLCGGWAWIRRGD